MPGGRPWRVAVPPDRRLVAVGGHLGTAPLVLYDVGAQEAAGLEGVEGPVSVGPSVASLLSLPSGERRDDVLRRVLALLPPSLNAPAARAFPLGLLSPEKARASTEADLEAWRFRARLLRELLDARAYAEKEERIRAILETGRALEEQVMDDG